MSQNESHRRRVTLKRHQRRGETLGAAQQAAQERARVQREINRQLRGWTWRRVIAWSLVAIAAVIGVNHVIAHLGEQLISWPMGWQDVLIGYPAAGVLALAGFVILGQNRVSK